MTITFKDMDIGFDMKEDPGRNKRYEPILDTVGAPNIRMLRRFVGIIAFDPFLL